MMQMEKLDPSPLNDRGIHIPLVKTIGKKVFHRTMQEPIPSDALNVLSEEENEEHVDCEEKKTVRYPLPTMPLSIMVPVNDIPDYVSPMDMETVRKKVSRFDINIATLMESRKKLASSYSLFDELCASFRGPENLDRFLQSLVTNRPMTALSSKNAASKNKFPETLQAAIQKTDSQQVPSKIQVSIGLFWFRSRLLTQASPKEAWERTLRELRHADHVSIVQRCQQQ